MIAIMSEMCTTMSDDDEIRQFIRSKAKCDNKDCDLRPFKLQFERMCTDCGRSLKKGKLAFCDYEDRRVHCLYCDFARHFTEA